MQHCSAHRERTFNYIKNVNTNNCASMRSTAEILCAGGSVLSGWCRCWTLMVLSATIHGQLRFTNACLSMQTESGLKTDYPEIHCHECQHTPLHSNKLVSTPGQSASLSLRLLTGYSASLLHSQTIYKQQYRLHWKPLITQDNKQPTWILSSWNCSYSSPSGITQ